MRKLSTTLIAVFDFLYKFLSDTWKFYLLVERTMLVPVLCLCLLWGAILLFNFLGTNAPWLLLFLMFRVINVAFLDKN